MYPARENMRRQHFGKKKRIAAVFFFNIYWESQKLNFQSGGK